MESPITSIIWSHSAQMDLQEIHDFIARDSELFADQFVSKLISAVDMLMKFPQSGRHVPEYPKDESIRELLYRSYRIIYRIELNKISIAAVVHGARDMNNVHPF